jgi:tetratricopeptide (TPR) repeat protein
MPAKAFMQVDPRRDHSFRVPRPDLAAQTKSPDACTMCHSDRDAAWAAGVLKGWFPDGRSGRPHYGQVLARGRSVQSAADNAALVDLALDASAAAIVRASALDLAAQGLTDASFARALPLFADDSALVRRTALGLLARRPPEERTDLAAALLSDPVQSVRLEAVRLLLSAPLDGLSESDRALFGDGLREFQRSLLERADYPETQMQIAGVALGTRDFEAAKGAFRTAARLDPQLTQAWLALARIEHAQEKPDRAIATLQDAAIANPGSAELFDELAFVYFSVGRNDDARQALDRSMSLARPGPDGLDLMANVTYQTGDLQAAIDAAKRLRQDFPDYQASELARRLATLERLR